MSSIEKLSIRGIRSFAPTRDEVIEFYHPLTVIVGANGCGKTTIIECLKISCTGSLPPGSRSGQNFVHDPKISGSTEVKACIRMRFKNRAGQPMVVQRSFQLQQQKINAKYKALDGVIRTVNADGEKVSMGHKCAELDKHIPELMGVSKAILESVIFCHQEDSNWPLQEGAVLKKRFDDIFESARYTKALDSIRKIRIEKSNEAKDHKRDLDILHHKSKTAEEYREKVEQSKKSHEDLEQEMEEQSKVISECREKLDSLNEELRVVQEIESNIQRYEERINSKQEVVKRAFESIEKLMDDSDEDLYNLLNNYDQIASQHESKLTEIHNEESKLQSKKQRIDSKHASLCVEKGKLQALIENQEKAKRDRDNILQDISMKYGFGSYSSPCSEYQIQEFMSKLRSQVNTSENNLREVQAENRNTEDSYAQELNNLNSRMNHCKQQIVTKKNDRSKVEEEKKKIMRNLRSASDSNMTQRRLNDLKVRIDDTQNRLNEEKSKNTSRALKDEIQAMNKNINDISFESDTLEEKLKVLRLHEHDRITLENRRQDYRSRLADFHDKVSIQNEVFMECLRRIPTTDTVSDDLKDIEALLNTRNMVKEEAQNDLKKIESQLSSVQASMNHLQADITHLRSQKQNLDDKYIKDLREIISETTPGDGLDQSETCLKKLEQKYFEAKQKTTRRQNTILFLQKYREKGEAERCCPLCTRSMNSEEQDRFSQSLREKTDDGKIREKIEKAKTQENASYQAWKKIEGLIPQWRNWKHIETQLSARNSKLEALNEELNNLRSQLKINETAHGTASKQYVQVQELHRYTTSLMENNFELSRVAIRIRDDEDRLAMAEFEAFGNEKISLQQVQDLKDSKHNEIQDINRRLQRKQQDLQTSNEVMQKLQSDLHQLRQESIDLEKKRTDYNNSKSLLDNLREREKILEKEIIDLDDNEPKFTQAVNAKMKERQEWRVHADALEKEAQEKSFQLSHFKQSASHAIDQAAELMNRDISFEIDSMQNSILEIETERSRVAKDLDVFSSQLESAKKSLEQHEIFKRQLRDNIDYRKLKQELDNEEGDLAELKYKLTTLNSAKETKARIQELNTRIMKSREHRATVKGRYQQLEEQIHDIKVKLKSSELKNIDERHRIKLIEFETTSMAVTDLEKYYKALDLALMEYHSRKITEINRIIKELWQVTYRGNDIDTIEIVSGQEKASKAGRSYNYRVVMRKGEALLDMRGRCSAGQKVIAALVIRLALAETFCLNCGILALDEPTTNLDTENKRGLAQAMTEILNARSNQQNFQLICITHDEDFVQMLGNAQMLGGSNPGYYWRVSREEMGLNQFYSRIERQDWGEQ